MTDECAEAGVDCTEVLATIELYLDGELPRSEMATLAVHFDACHPCHERIVVEEHVRRLVRSKCCDSAPDELKLRLQAKLAEWAARG